MDRTPAKRRHVHTREEWVAILRDRCEQRVAARRDELLRRVRSEASRAIEDIVTAATDEVDDDEGLTAEERLQLLLHLQDTLYAQGRAEAARSALDNPDEQIAEVEDVERDMLEAALHQAGLLDAPPLASPDLPAHIRAALDADAHGHALSPGQFTVTHAHTHTHTHTRTHTGGSPHTTPNGSPGHHRTPSTDPPASSDVVLLPSDAIDALSPDPSLAAVIHAHAHAHADTQTGKESEMRVGTPARSAAGGRSPARLPSTGVLCPVCRDLELYEFRSLVACRCGFWMDTHTGWGVSGLVSRLGECEGRHRELCAADRLHMKVLDIGGTRTLMCECPVCRELEVVM